MPALQLRDYQEACVEAHYSYFESFSGHPLFVVPTAGGKSLIIAEFLKRTLQRWPATRVVVLTHVKELIEQNHDALVRHWGSALCPVGIFSAGVGRREATDQIVFAGIQSVFDKVDVLGPRDLVLIDEAHLVPKKGQGRYLTYLKGLLERCPATKVCGYSATPYRLDGGWLHRGEGRLFTHIAYEVGLEELVRKGFLAPLVARRPENVIDTTLVGTSSTGDFNADELQREAMRGDCVPAAVNETVAVARASARSSWLFFATGVEHAKLIVECLAEHKVSAAAVFGETERDERARLVADFKNGRLQALVNVGVLTTGFDAPRCDLMAVMRPTQSAALYVQMMGRGMRIFPGKRDCLVLDYGLNVERHGPINRVRPKGTKGEGGGAAPIKLCPACHTYIAAGARSCEHCGAQFAARELAIDHEHRASTAAPIDFSTPRPEVHRVIGMEARRHSKENKPDSLRIDFSVGMTMVTEWLCLEHQGFARRKAASLWYRLGPPPAPLTVAEALERIDQLRQPLAVSVLPDGKDGQFLRIVDFYFGEEEVPEEHRDRVVTVPAGPVQEDIPF